jgi:hypothetical protein
MLIFKSHIPFALAVLVVQDHVSALLFGFVKRVGGLFSASIDDLLLRAQTVELVLLTLD